MENIVYLKTERNTEYIVDQAKKPDPLSSGSFTCVKIEEHHARGESDKWFYDVYGTGTNGLVIRIFDPVEVHALVC